MATPSLAIEHLDRVGSTQDEAVGRFEGVPVLVTATGQDQGRGRTGASWLDADRALAASVALAPVWPSERLPVLTLVAGLAALDVLPDRASLKWPNDVMIGSDKVGGILTEVADGLVVIGFGLNVVWGAPPAGIAAVCEVDPGVEHVRHLGERWARALLNRAAAGPDEWGEELYTARCSTIGRTVEWHPDGRGTAIGVDRDGSLLVETSGAVIAISSGEVSVVRHR